MLVIYLSDEFDFDDPVQFENKEETANSIDPQNESNLSNNTYNQNELLNKPDDTKNIQEIEDIANLSGKKIHITVLNADVPEFIPRTLQISSLIVDNNPEMPSSSSESALSLISEEEPNFSPEFAMNSDMNKSLTFLEKNCQTNSTEMVENAVQMEIKSINVFTQTLDLELQTCNCKQETEENEQVFKTKLISLMDENMKLHQEVKTLHMVHQQKIETLEKSYKEKLLENQEKLCLAENLAKIASIKLESNNESLQDKIAQLEAENERKNSKIEALEKKKEIIYSVISTQALQYFNLQKSVATKYINKCKKMIFDLNGTVPYLTVNSIPTVQDCGRHIEQWQKGLEEAEKYLVVLKDSYEQAMKDIHLGNFVGVSNCQELSTQFTETNDVLHDSYLPTVNILHKENMHHYQKNLQMQQQYSQWFNNYTMVSNARPAIISGAPVYYNTTPQGSTALQISDVTSRSARMSSVVITPPNVSIKPPPINYSTSENPEVTDLSTVNLTTVSDDSKTYKPEVSTSDLYSTTENSATKHPEQTDETPEGHRNSSWWNSKDEKQTVKPNVASNSTDSILNQASTDLATNTRMNARSLVKFSIPSKNIIHSVSVLDETEDESTLNSSLPLQDYSNSNPLLNYFKQGQRLDKTCFNLEGKDCTQSKVYNFQGTSVDSQNKENPVLLSLAQNTTPSSLTPYENETVATEDQLFQKDTLTVVQQPPKIVDYSKLPDAVRKAGRSFCDLYIYVRDRVPEKNDFEILSGLKKVRRKYTKLSGMTKDVIVTAVRVELKLEEETDGSLDTTPAKESTDCIVCIEPFGNYPLTELTCQHVFHRKCITQWLIYKNECPVCRVLIQ